MKPHRLIAQIAALLAALFAVAVHAADKKPNILIIWGDDIGWYNVSAYNMDGTGRRTSTAGRLTGRRRRQTIVPVLRDLDNRRRGRGEG